MILSIKKLFRLSQIGLTLYRKPLPDALQSLGPIFIKFGQSLSTRPDLIPQDIAESLSALQDKVPPFDANLAKNMIEKELKHSINDLFDDFENTPIGSASIAQVHGAKLKTGERVVVKVLRPDIHRLIKRDIELIKFLAKWASRFSSHAKQLRLNAVADELEKTLLDELDLVREAANSSVLKRHFITQTDFKVPKVYWEYTTKNIVTFERIHGTPIDDLDALREQGIDLKQVARMGVEMFFTQVFRDSYFHADLHPGNIFVTPPGDTGKPQLVLVDFGIMGTLSANDQRYLAQNLLAFTQRDYRRVAELHIASGWVPKETRVDEFESAIRAVCEPMLERPIKDISFGKLLLRLFETAQRFDMVLQPQLVLLQKTILNIEGVGRMLDPELNVWETANPIVRQWLKESMGLRATLKQLKQQWPFLAKQLPELPEKLMSLL